MKASIHIKTQSLEVLAYSKSGSRVDVQDYISTPIPDECVMNGVIVDAEPIAEVLTSLKTSHPRYFSDVSIVLDGSFVYSKKIVVPGKLNKKMYDGIIRDEFSDVATDSENLLCDYFPLGSNPDGSKQILGCAVEQTHVDTYLSLFKSCGIQPTSIHLGIEVIMQYINTRPEIADAPFVLNIVDDFILLSMIFQNGISVFQSRTRLFGEDSTSLARNSVDGLSGILQFNRSQNFEELHKCYYLGLSREDLHIISQINPYENMEFLSLDIYASTKGANKLPPDAHFVFLNTLMPSGQFNLLTSYKTLEKAKKERKPKNLLIPIVAGVAGILLVAIVTLFSFVRNVEGQVREIEDFLNHPETVRQVDEITILEAETAHINAIRSSIGGRIDFKEDMAHLTSDILSTLLHVSGSNVTINGTRFDSAQRTMSVSATALRQEDTARFVEQLSTEPLIYSVLYTGFTAGDGGTVSFTIEVIATQWIDQDDGEAD